MSSDKALDEVREAIDGYGVYAGMGVNATIRHFLDRNIVIPKSELPEVKLHGSYATVGSYTMAGSDFKSADQNRLDMLSVVAWHEYRVEQDAKAAEKEAALTKRRDELANKLINPDTPKQTHWSYSGTTDLVRRAVDMIIDIEDKK